jgi:hypothetical protein
MAKEVNIIVRGVPRAEPDLKRLARTLLRLSVDEQRRNEPDTAPAEPGADAGSSTEHPL